MSTIAGLVLVGFLVLVAAGLVCLVFAARHAPDGQQDSSGFHYDSGAPADGRAGTATLFAVDQEAATDSAPPDYLDSLPGTVRPIPH